MKYSLRSLMIVAIVTLVSCQSGCTGGGFYHLPPKTLEFGRESQLEFRMICRGYQGSIQKRYKSEKVWFRLRGDRNYQSASTQRELVDEADGTQLVITATIPAIPPSEGDTLEYYFTYSFDGVDESFGTEDSPKTVPIVSANE